MENALRTTGVARRRPAAEPEQWGTVPIGPTPAQSAALVDLGQALMFDKVLSGNRDIAAPPATTQRLTRGRTGAVDRHGRQRAGPSRTLGPGRQFIPRNAPTLVNAGLGAFYLFWDGRVSGTVSHSRRRRHRPPPGLPNLLTAQAMFPVLSREEMRGVPGDRDRFGNPNELAALGDSDFVAVWQAVMRRLLAIPEYVSKFTAAFPGTPTSELGFQHAATAIAAFETQALTGPIAVRSLSPARRCGVDLRTEARRPALFR